MKSMIMTVFLNQEDCYCDILELYRRAALDSDYNVTENTLFDCRKIHCSEEVFNEVQHYYRENRWTELQFAAAWVSYGPKADIINKKHSPYVIALEEGAIYEEVK